MYPLLVLLLAVLGVSIKSFGSLMALRDTPDAQKDQAIRSIRRFNSLVLQMGIFSFFLGLLSQELGLMQAFSVIQQVGAVSPTLLASGLYVSFIPPVFGLIILLCALISRGFVGFQLDK